MSVTNDCLKIWVRGFATLFFYKNKVYKNIEAEIGKILEYAKNIPEAEILRRKCFCRNKLRNFDFRHRTSMRNTLFEAKTAKCCLS